MTDRVARPRQEPPRLLTVAEVARYLHVSKMTIHRLIQRGELVTYRVGRSLRIDARSLDEYLFTASSPDALAPWGSGE